MLTSKMRKLGMNRGSKVGGAKKVAPPSVPGSNTQQTGGHDSIYMEYDSMSVYEGRLELGLGDTLDKSYESTNSEVIYSTYQEEPIYRRILPRNLRTFSSDSCVPRPTEFKEPFPVRSGSTSTPSPSYSTPSELSPAPRGSRNSVSSGDSGWASAPLASASSFGTRASNSSLNSDKTTNSVEEQRNSQIKQQRRLSSISSTGSIGLNSTFSSVSSHPGSTYSHQSNGSMQHGSTFSSQSSGSSQPTFPNHSTSSIGQRQDPNRQSLRTFGSSESVGSQGSRRASAYSRASSSASSGSGRTTSSSFRSQEGISSLDYAAMIHEGVGWEEIMNCWLSQLRFSEYYTLFVTAGYDIQTVSRMTPEDLTAIGIKKPNHRKKLKAAAEELNVGDGLPDHVPMSVQEFLDLLRLDEYLPTLISQGYKRVDDLLSISIEDLEDIGFFRLGHQKRLLLGIKKVKELKKLGLAPVQFNLGPYSDGHRGGGAPSQRHSVGQLPGHGYLPAGRTGPGGGGTLHYYPEEVSYSSLPPIPHPHRFSSFHQDITPLVHIREGEVYAPREQEVHRADGQYAVNADIMPRPMPPIEPLYNSKPQRFERSQSEDHRPSVWQRFKSFDDSDLVRRSSVGDRAFDRPGFNSGTLPRPKATVKPLPAVDRGGDIVVEHEPVKPNKIGLEDQGLGELRKPDFSIAEDEGLISEPDILLPFANERAGTIKYKTNPAAAFQEFREEDDDVPLPPEIEPNNHLPQSPHRSVDGPHHPTDVHPASCLSPGFPSPPGKDVLAALAAAEQQDQSSNSLMSSGSNLLRTPTRSTGRSAGDVLQDIGTMLADLTDELDTMLKLDKE